MKLILIATTALCPAEIWGQTAASVSLDGSGNLVLSATLEYSEFLALEIFDNEEDLGYWRKTAQLTPHQWVYYDLRNSNYENGYIGSTPPTNLVSVFENDPLDVDLAANSSFLQDLFYMGAYSFGDTDYEYPVPSGQPNIQLLGNNAYYAGKAGSRAIGETPTQDDNGTLSLRLVLPFDATTNNFLSPTEFHLKGDSGNFIADPNIGGHHAAHTPEYGYSTGGWVSSPTGCSAGDTIEDCGLIGGDYEFLVYLESHRQGDYKAISAFQSEIPYVRFTIVDEDSSSALPVTIVESTSYVGEADLVTGLTFTISNSESLNPNVDFIVGSGHGITLAASFKAELGTSFKTVLGGGTALSKGIDGQQHIAEDETRLPNKSSISKPGRVAVYPNPSSGSIWASIVSDSHRPIVISIHDVLGRTISPEVKMDLPEGQTKVDIASYVNLSSLSNGLYMLRVQSEEFVESTPFTVIR